MSEHRRGAGAVGRTPHHSIVSDASARSPRSPASLDCRKPDERLLAMAEAVMPNRARCARRRGGVGRLEVERAIFAHDAQPHLRVADGGVLSGERTALELETVGVHWAEMQ